MDIKPGNNPRIIERFMKGLRILNFNLETQYATERINKVEIMHTKTETITVFLIQSGNAPLTPLISMVNKSTKLSNPILLGKKLETTLPFKPVPSTFKSVLNA